MKSPNAQGYDGASVMISNKNGVHSNVIRSCCYC